MYIDSYRTINEHEAIYYLDKLFIMTVLIENFPFHHSPMNKN